MTLLVFIFGYGNCKHAALLGKFFFDKFKLKNRLLVIKNKYYSHIVNYFVINNKSYILDVCGKFFFECIKKNNTFIPHKFPSNKVSKLMKKQYFIAKNMNSSLFLSKKIIKKNAHKLYLDALKNTFQCKINYSKRKYDFSFPVYKNSKIIKNGFGIYDGKIYHSNEFNKFLNVENSIYYPKENFKKFKFGLIINFKIFFKNKKNNILEVSSENFFLKKNINNEFFDMSSKKKNYEDFLKNPNFILNLKDLHNIKKITIISLLSNYFK